MKDRSRRNNYKTVDVVVMRAYFYTRMVEYSIYPLLHNLGKCHSFEKKIPVCEKPGQLLRKKHQGSHIQRKLTTMNDAHGVSQETLPRV